MEARFLTQAATQCAKHAATTSRMRATMLIRHLIATPYPLNCSQRLIVKDVNVAQRRFSSRTLSSDIRLLYDGRHRHHSCPVQRRLISSSPRRSAQDDKEQDQFLLDEVREAQKAMDKGNYKEAISLLLRADEIYAMSSLNDISLPRQRVAQLMVTAYSHIGDIRSLKSFVIDRISQTLQHSHHSLLEIQYLEFLQLALVSCCELRREFDSALDMLDNLNQFYDQESRNHSTFNLMLWSADIALASSYRNCLEFVPYSFALPAKLASSSLRTKGGLSQLRTKSAPSSTSSAVKRYQAALDFCDNAKNIGKFERALALIGLGRCHVLNGKPNVEAATRMVEEATALLDDPSWEVEPLLNDGVRSYCDLVCQRDRSLFELWVLELRMTIDMISGKMQNTEELLSKCLQLLDDVHAPYKKYHYVNCLHLGSVFYRTAGKHMFAEGLLKKGISIVEDMLAPGAIVMDTTTRCSLRTLLLSCSFDLVEILVNQGRISEGEKLWETKLQDQLPYLTSIGHAYDNLYEKSPLPEKEKKGKEKEKEKEKEIEKEKEKEKKK